MLKKMKKIIILRGAICPGTDYISVFLESLVTKCGHMIKSLTSEQ